MTIRCDSCGAEYADYGVLETANTVTGHQELCPNCGDIQGTFSEYSSQGAYEWGGLL